jgi:hypothetical protein
VFVLEKPVDVSDGKTKLHVYLKQNHGGWNSDDNQNHNLGRVRLSVSGDAEAVADPVPARVREALAVDAAKRSPQQVQTIFGYWRTTVPEWSEANAKIAELWKQHPEGSTQLVLAERGEMRSTHILERGDFLKPKQEVMAGTPAFLNPMPEGAKGNRLDLARWMTEKNAPTTARAYVNRVWQTYFGTGIIETSEDLGTQSAAPSHRELLDWLAVDFMETGWSMKKLHRQIVTSSTYRQVSDVTPELLTKDPANRLLARGPRFRVEGEIVRDITLAASGLLNKQVGGPSVYPPAPDFLFQPPSSYGPKNWYEEKGTNRYRRGLYTFRFRSVPYPVFTNFDTPNGDVSCVRRVRSNTPLQALTLLNEPLFLEAAKALGEKALKEGGTHDTDRIRFVFHRTLARDPEAVEVDDLVSFLGRQRARKLSEPESWTALARVVLNLDETITKE